MQIIHIAAELAPIAKVGGLGDVVFGLSRQLSANGSQVRVIIPKYDCLLKAGIQDLHIDEQEVPSFYDGAWHLNTIWKGRVGTIEVYFIEPHHPSRFFHEGTLYTSGNREVERYLYFSRAVLDFIGL